MSSYRWKPWKQPALSFNTEYGLVSASSINTSDTLAWKASDGIMEGKTTSWESARDEIPAWWQWRFPVMLKISHLVLYNKYSGYDNVTKDVSVYADADKRHLIAQGTFEPVAFSVLAFDFAEPVVTDTLYILCENSHYNAEPAYVGLGEVVITAEEGIEQFTVRFVDWNGTILKEETVDSGGSVTPPADPVREGYSFTGWSRSTEIVFADMTVTAQYSVNPIKTESLLSSLKVISEELSLPVETGAFSDTAPDRYIVLTPLSDTFDVFADNVPDIDVQEVRISLFDKGNYIKPKNTLVRALLDADITITDRRYIGHEDDTGYHHYAIDVAQFYNM